MSVLVLPKKLKQLTTNSAFSPFHQEVSTIPGKQRPKLEVCNKILGQKKCSFGVKPKLVLHPGPFLPNICSLPKNINAHFLALFSYSRDSTVHIQTVTETTKMSQQLPKARQCSVVSPGAGEMW